MSKRLDWLTVEQRDAPLIVSFPHTGTDIPPEIEARCVSPWLAQGRGLVDR
jgi:N-formylglutamate deformylase